MTQPQGIQPQPVPETWAAEHRTMPDGSQAIVVQIQGVSGVHISFLPIEACEVIGSRLLELATQGKSKIILPPGVGNLVVGQFGATSPSQ